MWMWVQKKYGKKNEVGYFIWFSVLCGFQIENKRDPQLERADFVGGLSEIAHSRS